MADDKNIVEIEAKLKLDENSANIVKSELGKIKDTDIKVGADLTSFNEKIKTITSKDAPKKTVKVNVDGDTTNIDNTIKGLTSKFKDNNIKLNISADARSATTTIQNFINNLVSKLDGSFEKDSQFIFVSCLF